MAPLRCAAKFDPFLSLDCAPMPSTPAQSKDRKGSNFAIWQPCAQAATALLLIGSYGPSVADGAAVTHRHDILRNADGSWGWTLYKVKSLGSMGSWELLQS